MPKYMSYHEAIGELVITGRARCLSFWLLDYICGYYIYRYYIYYKYIYIYIYIYIYYLMFGRYSTLYLKPIWNHISYYIFILYCICLCLYWKESSENISFFLLNMILKQLTGLKKTFCFEVRVIGLGYSW